MLVIANAHTDFVKCLLIIPQLKILISGGSDKDVRLWDLSSLEDQERYKTCSGNASEDNTHDRPADIAESNAPTSLKNSTDLPFFASLPCIASHKGQHTRPIETLAYYPILSESDGENENTETGGFCIWSADSMGRICVWELWRNDVHNVRFTLKNTWLAHETAIYEIKMADGEAWTGVILPNAYT